MGRLNQKPQELEHGKNCEPAEGELLPGPDGPEYGRRLLKRTTRHRGVLLAKETVVVEEWAGPESGDA